MAPSNYDQLTSAERSAWREERRQLGLVHLDDATLTRRYRLRVAATGQLPVADCAAFGGKSASGHTGAGAIPRTLGGDQLEAWVEIGVEAVEAQGHRTLVPRIVTDAEADAIHNQFYAFATPDESKAMQA